jgi:hypothetical protein
MHQKSLFIRWQTAFALLVGLGAYAQMDRLHGDFMETRNGLHAGNLFRISFYNDGTFGRISPTDIGGEWLVHPGSAYLLNADVVIGAEVLDANGDLKHIFSSNRSTGLPASTNSGHSGPNGEWWTFLPLPGFANPDTDKIAMSKWPWAWPASWPDKWNDPVDPGWRGSWNGYFGKNQFNADEESYFIADDYWNRKYAYYPDSSDTLRKGLGLRMTIRGFQWANALVEDGIFILYDITNIGDRLQDKMVFAYRLGNNMGDLGTQMDSNDDNGAYDLTQDIAYMWDTDNIGIGGWGPVGYFGESLLESPGNPRDGIDNDGDAINGSGKVLSEADFAPRTLNAGDPICLIDYKTFKRTVTVMPNDTLIVHYLDQVFKFWPGKVLEEKPSDLVDNNLNGLIDENQGSTIGKPPNAIQKYLYLGAKYIDYFTGEGSDNLLIDERRDDGIDNDGDWNPKTDDVGQDGAPFTHDPGEGDGKPTPGEPHFDQTDIDESDMLGLTGFKLYYWPDIPLWDDENIWNAVSPGYLDDLMENSNVDMYFGSGYFPMLSGETERFSMGTILGWDKDDMYTNKYWFAKAYNENYNFSKAPNIPTVTAVAGDRRVTLVWDDFAEQSVDPISGRDFEGYRIYRSTDAFWRDMTPITDGQGSVTYRKPLAQFDLVDGYSGYAAAPVKGVQFWLGTNSGITHTFIDTTVVNGMTYYYAVTSYDHGDPVAGIPPSECTKFISVNQAYEIVEKGSNVQKVRPEAPSAGYVYAGTEGLQKAPGSTADGFVELEVVLPGEIKDDHRYRITFQEVLANVSYPATKSFDLVDLTAMNPLMTGSTLFHKDEELPITDGFRLHFQNSYYTLEAYRTQWNRTGIIPLVNNLHRKYVSNGVKPQSGDLAIVFGNVGIDTSTAFPPKSPELPAIPVNFKLVNLQLKKEMKFAFVEKDAKPGQEGMFTSFTTGASKRDQIIVLSDSLIPGWEMQMVKSATSLTDTLQPRPGDTAFVYIKDPFLKQDSLEFTVHAEKIAPEKARSGLDSVRVVPNPYIVTADWEPLNPYSSGRGPREIHFINLPQECVIRIFNITGQLVREIHHESAFMANGTEAWDMQTKDRLDIAYGIYLYHVDAGKIGTKVGKFAVIK